MQETYQGQSIEASSTIQKSFVANLNRKDRTVKQAGFLVLRETYMPSVLVEVGFLTNKKEGQYLNSKKGQQEMATTIAKAILNYKNQLDASVSSENINGSARLNQANKVPEEQNSATAVTASHPTVTFKVQIAASSKLLKLNKRNFKGLKNLSVQQNEQLYRYYYGQTTVYETAEKLKQKAVKAGYEHAFLVAFKDGVKISISDAISQNK